MNPTCEQLHEQIIDLETALKDELARYVATCRPLLRAKRDAEDRLWYLDWVESLEAEGPNQQDDSGGSGV